VFLSGLYAEGELELLLSGPEIQVRVGEQQFQSEAYEEGFTTGEPIAAVVLSTSKKSRHYEQFAGPTGEVRPGHTDLVKYHQSKGFVDIRGGGRSSYRSTISDVIGGSIARLFLHEHFGTVILSSICQVGPLNASQSLAAHFEQLIQQTQNQTVSLTEISRLAAVLEQAEIYSLDVDFAQEAAELIKETRKQGDSIGAAVEVVAVNVPPLAGDPLYQSLKVRLMGTLGGLNAAQFCEVGAGADIVARRGSENNDPIRRSGYQSNNQGGLIGGITTGLPLVCRVGFKPTSTIIKPQQSVRKNLEEIDFMVKKGRHDPCVGVRAGVTLESRMAIELMNAVLMHQTRSLDIDNFKLF
jgi:chorismate synthase